MLTPDAARALVELLQRTPLNGREVPTFNALMEILNDIITPPKEPPSDAS